MSIGLTLKSIFVNTASSESLMLQYAKTGDKNTLALLYDTCGDDLYHFVLTLSDKTLAKDICQIILQHHDRYFLDRLDNSDLQDYYAILKLAEHIVHLKYHEVPSADWAFVQDNVLYTLGIKESRLDTLISDMQQKI